ncbi:hypothetical protein MOQ_007150 [Trypanosoma cruzi marinkellei]|uniref:Uncharacterized protein n=1 Tax=Trypanosoma cruzi marinkellei TaxID=85056 RepID=K2NJM1_TRYCR|nr:hypothetical protein MOQ_007150 [Trypanosoma cruzi marinkellei]
MACCLIIFFLCVYLCGLLLSSAQEEMNTSVYLQPLQPQLVASLMEAMAHASSLQHVELSAAITIQSFYRMWRDRRSYRVLRSAVVCLQRMYRGHMHRKRVAELREEAEASHERAVYEYYATRIQACFRGYYVRCRINDFYAKKFYIEHTVSVSSHVQEMANKMLQDRLQEELERRRSKQEQAYKEATEKLHHLISTTCVSGIYRRPVIPCSTVTVYGTSVENDIRNNSGAALRLQHKRRLRETLKKVVSDRRKDGMGAATITDEDFKKSHSKCTGDKNEAEGNVSKSSTLRGAWNRSGIERLSLPPIKTTVGSGNKYLGKIVSHSCIDEFEPMYDTNSAALRRCVDAKEIEALHGKKPFVSSFSTDR